MLFKCKGCGYERELVRKPRQDRCKRCKNVKNKHGDAKKDSPYRRLHMIWMGIINRCRFKPGYSHVERCQEWSDYKVFKVWALANGYANNLTIDRKDGTGNYEPSNCRWVTPQVQADNQKLLIKSNTSGYRGVTKRHGKFITNLKVNGKTKQVGTFLTIKEAALAYNQALDHYGYKDRPKNKIERW